VSVVLLVTILFFAFISRPKLFLLVGLFVFCFSLFSIHSFSSLTLHSILYSVLVTCLVGINFLFYYTTYTFTKKGRELSNHIKGFEMYLRSTNQKDPSRNNECKLTSESCPEFLPHVIAFGIEKHWIHDIAMWSGSGSPYFVKRFTRNDILYLLLCLRFIFRWL